MAFNPNKIVFPDPKTANEDGILAIGGNLNPETLLNAYNNGIFPWFNPGEPIIWWSPEKRMVLKWDDLKISKSMAKIISRKIFKVTFNLKFSEVIVNCKEIERDGQFDTWITNEMVVAYNALHQRGIAKSVEVWLDDKLVGGLYGVDLGHVFCGESMFSKVPNASKVAFIALAQKLQSENYALLDCQVHNSHLESLGCKEISRDEFLVVLRKEAI